jgi:hypothetical protein
VEIQNEAGAAAQLHLRSSITAADLCRSTLDQHSTTVPAAVEPSADHSNPRESAALITSGAQASSPGVAKPVDLTLVMIVDRESTLTEVNSR